MDNEVGRKKARGWNNQRNRYSCTDGAFIHRLCRTASVRDLDETKTVLRNAIRYTADEREVRPAASGVEYDRNMAKIFGGPDGVRTIVFPTTVKIVR